MRVKKTGWLLGIVFYVIALGSCSTSKTTPSSVSSVGDASHSDLAAIFSPLTNLSVNITTAGILDDKGSRYLYSELKIENTTSYPTKVFIQGWMLDSHYKRYPLFVEISDKKSKKIVAVEIPSQSSVNVSYLAEGDPSFTLGKRSIAMLALKDQDGITVNLTIPHL
jgi:hypothetical protein